MKFRNFLSTANAKRNPLRTLNDRLTALEKQMATATVSSDFLDDVKTMADNADALGDKITALTTAFNGAVNIVQQSQAQITADVQELLSRTGSVPDVNVADLANRIHGETGRSAAAVQQLGGLVDLVSQFSGNVTQYTAGVNAQAGSAPATPDPAPASPDPQAPVTPDETTNAPAQPGATDPLAGAGTVAVPAAAPGGTSPDVPATSLPPTTDNAIPLTPGDTDQTPVADPGTPTTPPSSD